MDVARFSPTRPASWSWILSISMGVVTTTWHMPAPQPASISLNNDSPFLLREEKYSVTRCPRDDGEDFLRRSCLPVLGEVMPEEVISSQLNCFLRGDQCQIYSSAWRKKHTQLAFKSQTGPHPAHEHKHPRPLFIIHFIAYLDTNKTNAQNKNSFRNDEGGLCQTSNDNKKSTSFKK